MPPERKTPRLWWSTRACWFQPPLHSAAGQSPGSLAGVGPSWSGGHAHAATVLLLQAVSGHSAALQGTACTRAGHCLGGGQAHAAVALPAPVRSSEVCLKQSPVYAGGQVAAHADFDIHCRFFSSLIQRAAKVHRRSGGGSLTMLAVLPGSPATGMAVSPASVVAHYKHLSRAQKQKLLAALEGRQQQQMAAESSSLEEGRVRTEVRCMPNRSSGAMLLTCCFSLHRLAASSLQGRFGVVTVTHAHQAGTPPPCVHTAFASAESPFRCHRFTCVAGQCIPFSPSMC